jgi:hypothetical protein
MGTVEPEPLSIAVSDAVWPRLEVFRELLKARHPAGFYQALGTGHGGDVLARADLTVGWEGLDEAIVVEVRLVDQKGANVPETVAVVAEVRGLNSRAVHARIQPIPFRRDFGVPNFALAASVIASSICLQAEYMPLLGLHEDVS